MCAVNRLISDDVDCYYETMLPKIKVTGNCQHELETRISQCRNFDDRAFDHNFFVVHNFVAALWVLKLQSRLPESSLNMLTQRP